MYFPHAFRKSFLPATAGGAVTAASTGTTASLTAGQIGFFDAKTYAVSTTGTSAPFIIAQGSYFTSDKIGPVHGGYKESVKSKVINPKYISRLITVAGKSAQNQKVTVTISNVEMDKTYRLRVDLKGSPALRFLSHNLYRVLDAYTGCGTAGDLQDPTVVAIKWAKQLTEYPLLKNFVSCIVKDTAAATVNAVDYDTFTPASVTSSDQATLEISVAYLETKFGTCTFTPTDKYELEPLLIYTSFVDETGDPCYVSGISSEETQEAIQASGVGETVLRELIQDGRYLQNAYPDSSRVESLRMREIEADPMLSEVDRQDIYDQVLILHNVPRFNNPTGTFDNDQYLLVIHVPTGTDVSDITDYIVDACAAAGNDVTVEAY